MCDLLNVAIVSVLSNESVGVENDIERTIQPFEVLRLQYSCVARLCCTILIPQVDTRALRRNFQRK